MVALNLNGLSHSDIEAILGLEYSVIPEAWAAPYFIGLFLDAIFLGLLISQVDIFFRSFPSDKPSMKRFVALIFILSWLKGAQTFSFIWTKFVSGWGNNGAAEALPWVGFIEPVASQLLKTFAQSFFVWRGYKLTNRNRWLLVVPAFLLLISIGMSIGLSWQLAKNPFDFKGVRIFGAPMLFISVAVDIILTSVVSYRLWTARSGLSTETETLVTRVLAMTWQAAIPPMVSGVLEAVCFEVSLDTNLAYATFSFLTPRLYVCALMYTLNSRLSMRGMYNHDLPIHNKTLEQGMSPNEPHMSILGGPHAGSQQYGSAFPIRSKLAAEGLTSMYTLRIVSDLVKTCHRYRHSTRDDSSYVAECG